MWRRGSLYGAGMSGVRLVPSGDVRVGVFNREKNYGKRSNGQLIMGG